MTDRTSTVLRLLQRIPVALWLFLAATQLLTFADRTCKLPGLEHQIQWFAKDPRLSSFVARFEAMYWSNKREQIVAAILAPLSLGCAYVKWSSTRPWARRFSLRTLLIVMTVVAVLCGVLAYLLK